MKKFMYVLLIIVLIMSSVSCSNNTQNENLQSQEPVQIKVAGLKGPTSIGMIKMFEENPSLGQNTETSYEVIPTPDALVGKLLNGEFDFATLPSNVAATIYNKNKEYQVIGVPVWGVLYVVTNNVEINDWSDFKGKTINPFMQGSTPDVIFKYLLQNNGLNIEEDVTFDYSIKQAELAQALAAGRVDIAILPEPFVTVATMKNKDLSIAMDLQEEWKEVQKLSSINKNAESSYPQTAVIVKSEFAIEHPEVVSTFINEYKNSIDWVNNNPKDAGVLVEKHEIGLKAAQAQQAIPRCNLDFKTTENTKEEINFYLNVLYNFSAKYVGGSLPDENFYYSQD